MSLQSPFREEDLASRVDALRAEREDLLRALSDARGAAAKQWRWSWWRFLLGLAVLPGVCALFLLALAYLG